MKIQFSKEFHKIYKKLNVRIQKAFDNALVKFIKDPDDKSLDNHELHEPYKGLRSIDVTNDYRGIYEEFSEDDEKIAYFEVIATHEELYDKQIFTFILEQHR